MIKPENFYTPPEPKEVIAYTCKCNAGTYWTTVSDCILCGGEPDQEIANTEEIKNWKAKHVKPEPEWVSFEEREPEIGQKILFRFIEHDSVGMTTVYTSKHKQSHPQPKHWADEETYDKALSYYNEHRVLFEGWEKVNDNHASSIARFKKQNADIRFFSEDRISITKYDSSGNIVVFEYFGAIIDETTLRSILKLNGIEP